MFVHLIILLFIPFEQDENVINIDDLVSVPSDIKHTGYSSKTLIDKTINKKFVWYRGDRAMLFSCSIAHIIDKKSLI